MKPISLRMRLTLVTVGLISLLALILTLTNAYNADSLFAEGTAEVDRSISETAVNQAYAEEQMDKFNSRGLVLLVGTIIAGGLCAYLMLGFALRPIRELARQVGAISGNNLKTRIRDFRAGDEIDSLADSFNGMLDRLDTAFESRQRFTSSAAHELKTPLSIVKTNLDVLGIAKDPDQEKYREVFRAVRNQNERMIRLVEDLLNMSMQQEYAMQDLIDPGELFREILLDLQDRIAETELTVTVENHGAPPLRCNAEMLRRALLNLTENAVKYNRKGGRILIDLTLRDRTLQITVSDTGAGIPAEHRERIFEPFYRVDSSRSRKTAGSGLGLAIVRDTVRRHGGTVSVYPTAGGGSAFVVALPVVEQGL